MVKIREATSKPGTYAYRGQKDSRWPLYSAATRKLVKAHGIEILNSPNFLKIYLDYHRQTLIEPASTRRFDVEDGRKISDLQLLAKLQHFGAATGLLDFTWNALVALYFASESTTDPPCDGKLFVIDTDNTIEIASIPSDEKEQSLEIISSRSDQSSPRLLYWEPIWSGEAVSRILRQRSVFILGRPSIPEGDVIKEILIDKEDKVLLLKDLELLDIAYSSLFQDIYGFSQTVKVTKISPQRTSTPITKPEDILRQGNHFYQQRDYPKAIASYDLCINLTAERVSEPYFLRGNAKAEMRDFSGAKQDYDLAVKNKDKPYLNWAPTPLVLNPSLCMIYFNRGNIKSQLSDYEGALQDYNEALLVMQLDWQKLPLFFNRANTKVMLHNFDDAIKDYDEAARLDSPHALFNKGNVLVVMGCFQKAYECYEKSFTLGIGNSRISAINNHNAVQGVLTIIEDAEGQIHITRNQSPGMMPSIVSVQMADKNLNAKLFSFQGNVGNTGNFGGDRLPGGKGFPGGLGFSVLISGMADKDR